jgi:hypothetical protein
MKYSVSKGNSQEFILMKDGIQSFCPFTQPFLMPSLIDNEVNLMRVPCSTQCPHATYEVEYLEWSITCAGGKQIFDINESENLKVI